MLDSTSMFIAEMRTELDGISMVCSSSLRVIRW
jgi:hypothetical protein